jgi:hypothetical protein
MDMCFYLIINEVFALCPQLINFLRSSNTTLSSLLLSHFASELRATVLDLFNSCGNISTHVLRKVCNISIRVSLYIYEPQANILIHGPRKIPVYINTYYTHKPQGNRSIHITRKLHIYIITYFNLYIYEPQGKILIYVIRKIDIYIY